AERASVLASSWLATAAYYDDGDDPIAATRDVVSRIAPGAVRIGVEKPSPFLSLRRFERLAEALPGREWVDLSPPLARLRLVKSAEELAAFRAAAAAIEAGMAAGVAATVEGATERDVAAAIARALVRAGADNPIPGVIATGERLGQVHAVVSDRRLRQGDLI